MMDVDLIRILIVAGISLLLAKVLHIVAKWWLHHCYLRQRVPEPCKAHWLRGHLAADNRRAKETYLGYARKLPRMFRRQMGLFSTSVSVSHPETIADAMRANPGKNELICKLFRAWLGNGLLISKGERWARDHKLLTNVFSLDMRREYVGFYKEATSIMLDLWEGQPERWVDASQYFPNLTFDIILRCAMGAETNCQTERSPNSPAVRYETALKDILLIVFQRLYKPWLLSNFIFYHLPIGRRFQKLLAETHEFSEQLISERRTLLQKCSDKNDEENRRRDMLDVLLTARDEEGVGYSDTEVREHVETFLFAGHDTTSSAFQWAIHYLSLNTDVQERCRQEVLAVLEKCSGLDNFAHENLAELEYLTQTIQEVLRIANIVPYIAKTSKKPTQVDGISFPTGTNFQINIMGVHHSKEVWSDPDTFNPDRFSPDKVSRSSYAFIPFSCGPRACLGKHFAMDEMKVVLSMILSKFRFVPDPLAEKPAWRMGLIVKPDPGVSVCLELV
ncbi:prostaglandin E2 omega-hydroxylase CYP4F21-like [Sycon ciliatum]|uniref:prostaglandin E2 omega-hydroxylase CYP4F21-like n=1 Tax=Sycon ciliatum TaxID=27933 RepID=UPI0031F6724A